MPRIKLDIVEQIEKVEGVGKIKYRPNNAKLGNYYEITEFAQRAGQIQRKQNYAAITLESAQNEG